MLIESEVPVRDTAENTSTSLAVIPASAISTIISADKDDILAKLAAKVSAHRPDVSTTKGRKEIASLAAEVASSKMDLIRLGKSLTEGWRKSTAAVNAECKVIEERMDELKEQVRSPLTEFERREKDRVAAHEAAVKGIADLAVFTTADPTIEALEERYAEAQQTGTRDWQEFAARAADTRAYVVDMLAQMLADKRRRDAEAAELARLREEKAERERQEADRLRLEREAQIAARAAEDARLAAEAEAARKAQEVAEAAERTIREAEAKAAAERAEIERKAQAERDRAAAELAAAERRAANEREAAARREREAQAAAQAVEAAAARERAAAAEREAAQKRRAEAAEQQAVAARAQAERERQQAVEAERKRAADAKAAQDAEDAKRAANKAHRAKINNAVLTALTGAGMAEQEARDLIVRVARGEIPHMSIAY